MEMLKTRTANIHDSFRLSACSWNLSTFALAAHLAGGLTHYVRLGGRGLDNPLQKAVGIDRNDAAKITGDRNNQNILVSVYLHWAFIFMCWLCQESSGFVAF
jgi:hypothetical protein